MTFRLTTNEKKRLKLLGIAVVYFFGSRKERCSRKNSDFDIAVLLEGNINRNINYSKIYDELYELFSDVIERTFFTEINLNFFQTLILFF